MSLKKNDTPVQVSQYFDQPVQKVWRAITRHEEMTGWYFENIPAFIPEPGFSTSFLVTSGTRNFTHRWKINEVNPGRSISYSWSYLEYPGDSLLTMQLRELHGGTQLTVIHKITEDFPEGIPEFERESCLAGWNYFIKERLQAHLSTF